MFRTSRQKDEEDTCLYPISPFISHHTPHLLLHCPIISLANSIEEDSHSSSTAVPSSHKCSSSVSEWITPSSSPSSSSPHSVPFFSPSLREIPPNRLPHILSLSLFISELISSFLPSSLSSPSSIPSSHPLSHSYYLVLICFIHISIKHCVYSFCYISSLPFVLSLSHSLSLSLTLSHSLSHLSSLLSPDERLSASDVV